MKRYLIATLLVLLIATAVAGRTTIYQGSGTVGISITSGFFEIDWGLFNGLAHFEFDGPNIDNATGIGSFGAVQGTFDVSQFSFNQTVTAYDESGIFTGFQLPNGTVTVLTFTGTGFTEVTVNAGDLEGKTDLFAFLDAEFYWIMIRDDRPALRAKLRLEAVGFDGPLVRMVVRNVGGLAISGNAVVQCGLSYEAYESHSYSLTRFEIGDFGYRSIAPGDIVSFDFYLPESIPEKAIEAFLHEREIKLFESDHWQYPDPSVDCLDFILIVGDKTDVRNHVHAFSSAIQIND
jgi:hypothetical protein